MTFCQFLSTPSARRATGRRSAATGHPPDFYPRPPQGGRRFSGLCLDLRIDISIHALRKEGDRQRRTAYESESISIHALRKEGDAERVVVPDRLKGFLSTPSARRATRAASRPQRTISFLSTPSARRATSCGLATRWTPLNFYPRPPQGGRPPMAWNNIEMTGISIHALRKEGDLSSGSRF